ncbi:MAG: hypothetical protein M0P14_04915 [Alkaliphilus sp.]|nr:hypothetical protein [Alkaliphilus sp.]
MDKRRSEEIAANRLKLITPRSAIPLKIQSHSGAKPSLPERLTKKEAKNSRLLNTATTVNQRRK